MCCDEFENKGVWCGLKDFESINVVFEYVIIWNKLISRVWRYRIVENKVYIWGMYLKDKV